MKRSVEDARRLSMMKRNLFYANAYLVTRHYGGPEEGGWWFDAGELLATTPYETEEQAKTEAERLKELYSNKEWGDVSSVNGGAEVEAYATDEMGESYPKERPYYE